MNEMVERVAQRLESVPEYGVRKNKANPPEARYEIFYFTDEGDAVILSSHSMADIADSERYSLQREGNARAAIEAMREPTEKMKLAGDEVLPEHAGFDDDASGAYRAMIDAALN